MLPCITKSYSQNIHNWRRLYRDLSKSHESVDGSQDNIYWSHPPPPPTSLPPKPQHTSSAAISSSISSLSSMSNVSSMGSINNCSEVGVTLSRPQLKRDWTLPDIVAPSSNLTGNWSQPDATLSHHAQLKGDWPLPPLRRRPLTSASLEQARRISRSLSFLLGEPDSDSQTEDVSAPHHGPSSHVLPPLSPHMPPPLLTRTATSPHFPGQAQ